MTVEKQELRIGDKEERLLEEHGLAIETRNDGVIKLRGYAAVFNKFSIELLGFKEIIRPGAFSRSLNNPDVRALWNHDTGKVLGRIKNRTLELWEDQRGLGFSVVAPNTAWARDAMESIRRGDVDQMSFGFTVHEDKWTEPKEEGKLLMRELLDVTLFEISPVTFPAYPQTTVGVRDLATAMHEHAKRTRQTSVEADLAQKRKRLTLIERIW